MSRFEDKKGCGSTYVPTMTINELIVKIGNLPHASPHAPPHAPT